MLHRILDLFDETTRQRPDLPSGWWVAPFVPLGLAAWIGIGLLIAGAL